MKPVFPFLLLFFTLCQNIHAQERELGVSFSHKFNGNEFVVGSSTFPIWNGKMVWIKRAEFYLSGFSVKDEAGQVTNFPDTYLLVRAQDASRRIVIGNVGATPVSKMYMSVGIDTTKNHDDPTLYPETHPLGLKEPSMHWGWAGGYRFLVIEGKVDNSGDGIPETDFEYHNLGDDLYKQTEINITPAIDKGGDISLNIEVDYARLFDQNTMLGNQIVHGSSAKNLAMIKNAVNNGFFSLATLTSTYESPKPQWSVESINNQWLIQTPGIYDAVITVADMAGQTMARVNTNDSGITIIPAHDLPAGIWLVTLSNPYFRDTQKVIIVR